MKPASYTLVSVTLASGRGFTMEGLDPVEMAPGNIPTLYAQAVWDYELLEGSCQSFGGRMMVGN